MPFKFKLIPGRSIFLRYAILEIAVDIVEKAFQNMYICIVSLCKICLHRCFSCMFAVISYAFKIGSFLVKVAYGVSSIFPSTLLL